MKKRCIAMLAVLVLVLGLAACGGNAPEEKTANEKLREALPGLWEITAWDLTTGGYLNVVEGWYLQYTDDTIWFYMDGELVNEEGYEWISEDTIHFWYKEDPSYVGDWKYELQEDGTINITYEEYGTIYYTEKCPEGTDPLDYKPIDDKGDITGTPIAPEDLLGTWNLLSMTVAGTETALEDQAFEFTADTVTYLVSGAAFNASSYVFVDEYNMTVTSLADTSVVANWAAAVQEDGTLLITDTTNAIIYKLSK